MSIWSTASSDASVRWTPRIPRAAGAPRSTGAARYVAAGLLLLAACLAGPDSAAAQDPNLVDQGRYDIRIGERVTGTETYAIRRQGEGYMAVGRIQVEGSVPWLGAARFGLLTDGSFSPVRYEIRAEGGGQSLIAIRTGTRFRITTSGAEGDRMTELLANPNQLLLGPGIAQHYYFLVRRLAAGSGGRLTALLPDEGREVPITVSEASDVSIDLGGASVPARRWELSVGGVTHLVWADPSSGRILRAEIPDRQWRSVLRTGE